MIAWGPRTMRKLIAAMKISVDGKAGGADGYADWVEGWSDDYGLTGRIDACLIGGGMYPGYEQYWTAIQDAPDAPLPMTGQRALPAEREWAEFARRTPHYVLSNSLERAAWPHTRMLRTVDDVRALKRRPGRDIYLMGGPTLVASMLDEGLVDECHFIVYPLVAGKGNGLFAAVAQRRRLELMASRSLGAGKIALAYAVS